eukprot:4730443-Pyramimonas_sp.AAC.1
MQKAEAEIKRREQRIFQLEQRQDAIIEELESRGEEGAAIQHNIEEGAESIKRMREEAQAKVRISQGSVTPPSPDQLGINLAAWTKVLGAMGSNAKAELAANHHEAVQNLEGATADIYAAATEMAIALPPPPQAGTHYFPRGWGRRRAQQWRF